MADDNPFETYIRENLATESISEKGTSIPMDSLAQIMQEIIKLDPELQNFVGNEIRTGNMDEDTYKKYCWILWSAYHLLIRGKQYSIPMKYTPKDILMIAKVMASASTSIKAKLLETLVSQKRDVNVSMPKEKKGFLKR